MRRLLVVLLLSLTYCRTAPLPAPIPAAAPEPVSDWRSRVTAARALDDPVQKNDAMLALLREALPDREVRLSGSSDADHVHPQDNQAAPIVNFDPRLQQKQSARARSGAATRSLENNFGYYFSVSGVPYVVVGPAALDPRTPLLTQLAVEHEMFHAENHVGDSRAMDDRELETWSTMFVRFFARVHAFNQQWRPMLSYYEKASEAERGKAIDRLTAYYRKETPEIRAAFDKWLARRKTDLQTPKMISDLEKAINS